MVRHHSQTLVQISKLLLAVVRHEHSLLDQGAHFRVDIIILVVGLKVRAIFLLLFLDMHEFPLFESLLEFKQRQTCIGSHQSDFSLEHLEGSRYHGLVLHRVQRARRVGHLAADLKQFDTSLEDLQLEGMKCLALLSRPLLPFLWDLPDSCI